MEAQTVTIALFVAQMLMGLMMVFLTFTLKSISIGIKDTAGALHELRNEVQLNRLSRPEFETYRTETREVLNDLQKTVITMQALQAARGNE